MKFGMTMSNVGAFARPEAARGLIRAAETAGFESLWVADHVVIKAEYESAYPYSRTGKMPGDETTLIADPLVWLTWAAGESTSLRLATGIVILPQRNPLVLAKQCASLDVLSGGRLILGIGVGWMKEEFAAIGTPFEGRGRRAEEYIDAMRALWSGTEATYRGDTVSFDACVSRPSPLEERVPIVIGGHSEVAARRAGRLGDGFYPLVGDTTVLQSLLDALAASADAANRDPASIEVTCSLRPRDVDDTFEQLDRLRELGVARVTLPPFSTDVSEQLERIREFGETVVTSWTTEATHQ